MLDAPCVCAVCFHTNLFGYEKKKVIFIPVSPHLGVLHTLCPHPLIGGTCNAASTSQCAYKLQNYSSLPP